MMNTATILIVEDNPITRKMLRVALQSEGYKVLEAGDGQTALELLSGHSPALILQDLILPDMDGYALVQRCRALPAGSAIPILAVSGFLSEGEQGRSLQAGFTDYLFKPVEPSHLLHVVQAYLRRHRAPLGHPGRGRSVLVAEDDPLQRKVLKIHLEQLGFQVTTAEDGVDALEKARASTPDAIVSDVLMPRLDGFRLCLEVRREKSLTQVPVLLISAVYTEEKDRQLAVSVGASGFLMRTPDNREVIEALLAALNDAPAPQPAPEIDLPVEEYAHRVIRQLEHQVGLGNRLTRRLALQEAELGILARIVETLQGTSAPETVLGELLYRCLDAAGISRGAAYLRAPDGRLALQARLGYTAAFDQSLPDFFGHADLLHQVMEQGEPIEVSAGGNGPDRARDLLAKSGAKSMLLAPLLLGEERLGVLQMATLNHDLGEDWISFAKAVGSHMGQALELARTLSRLSASEQRYRMLFERNLAGILHTTRDGRILDCNDSFARILGYASREAVRARQAQDFYFHPQDRQTVLAQLDKHSAVSNQELCFRQQDGGPVWVLANISLLEDPAWGALIQGTIVDLTERKQAAEQEAKMRMAREIQYRLFPAGGSPLAGFDMGGASFPAEATGGDYFDYIPMPNDCTAIIIGDVSGHGFGSALLMAETRAYLRALALTNTDVGAILTLLNQALVKDLQDSFVTLILAQLDPSTRSFTYTNAGHPRGYILDRSGQVKKVLESSCFPIGIEADAQFAATAAIPLEEGDLVLFLTDGIVEARSPDDTVFGDHRALEIVRLYQHDPARQIVENLYHAVRAFSQNCAQTDDITAVVLKVELPA